MSKITLELTDNATGGVSFDFDLGPSNNPPTQAQIVAGRMLEAYAKDVKFCKGGTLGKDTTLDFAWLTRLSPNFAKQMKHLVEKNKPARAGKSCEKIAAGAKDAPAAARAALCFSIHPQGMLHRMKELHRTAEEEKARRDSIRQSSSKSEFSCEEAIKILTDRQS
jgi:hypothetical protein